MTHPRALLSVAGLTLALAGPARADTAADAAALTSRVKARTLSEDRLEVAALLGDEAAKLALGRPPREDALTRCGHEASVRLALAGLRAAAKRQEAGASAAPVARALTALEAWLGCPCPEHAAACRKVEEELDRYTEELMDLDREAPDADARFHAAQLPALVGYAAQIAVLSVRAPLEPGGGKPGPEPVPSPAPALALDVVRDACEAEALVRGDEAPRPTDAAAAVMAEAFGGGPSTAGEAGRADYVRWQEQLATFERACAERALVDVRAAYLPWLLGGTK